MPTVTPQVQLEAVNQAILRISQGGKSFTTPTGVTYTAADLDTLITLRDRLSAEVSSAVGRVAVPAGPGFVSVALGGAGSDRL